jgi:hypothetical protein
VTLPNIISKRINTYLGLNNLLNPASAEYREGMAYRAKDCRLDRTGIWAARPVLTASSGEPTRKAFDETGWGTGNHYKNLAVQGTDLIIETLATTESVDVGANEILYGTRGAGTVARMTSGGVDSLVAAPTNPTVNTVPADTGATPTRQANGTYFYIFTSYNSTYKHESIPAKAYQVETRLEYTALCALLFLTVCMPPTIDFILLAFQQAVRILSTVSTTRKS